MIENLVVRRVTITKHKEAPLLGEREDYLSHLAREEKCRRHIHDAATVLLNIIRVMEMTTLRQVDTNEIALAAQRWAGEDFVYRRQPNCNVRSPLGTSATPLASQSQGLMAAKIVDFLNWISRSVESGIASSLGTPGIILRCKLQIKKQ